MTHEYVKLRGFVIPTRTRCEGCQRKRFCMPYVKGGPTLVWFCLRCARGMARR